MGRRKEIHPRRYIVHPAEVMEICSQYTNDITILAAALLHDVLELTAELTDIYTKEDYPKFNRRVSKDREQPEKAGERKPLNMQT